MKDERCLHVSYASSLISHPSSLIRLCRCRISRPRSTMAATRTNPRFAACVFSHPMINNLPVKTLKHGELTIEGYSRAAVQTYWRFPELKLGFDLGAQPWSFMGTETWFVTHGHLDHIVALPVYVARRRMMKMTPPVIYMPAETIEPMQRILRQFTKLDRGRLPC